MSRRKRASQSADDAVQVIFAFKASLSTPDIQSCRMSGELCVWMSPAASPSSRRTLVSGSEVTGHITSSREPTFLGQPISGSINGSRVWGGDAPQREWHDTRRLEVELCGLRLGVGLSELHDWEQDEGGKLILANADPLWTADKIAVLFTTLSARRPSPQAAVSQAAESAQPPGPKRTRRSARLNTAPIEAADDPWSSLASRFLARYFRLLTDADRVLARQQGIALEDSTHIHIKSGQCHQGPKFAAAAVRAYQEFLRLKARQGDSVCQVWIDEVWHTHLQDVSAYQRDCAALLGSPQLIEHSPLPPTEQRQCYRVTYHRRRNANQAAAAAAGEYDDLFWPEPRAEQAAEGDDDDDTHDDFSIERELEEDDVVCG